MADVRTGTAGWTDKTLLATDFYPPGARTPEGRLRHYATQFGLVEVDASYYALPTATMVRNWVERTPDGFTFDVKAFASLTGHPVEIARLPKEVREALPANLSHAKRAYPKDLPETVVRELRERFVRALVPMVANGRLGAVLMQFPPWFDATKQHADELARACEALGELPLSVEFRNATWAAPERRARVLALVRSLGAAYVNVDEPQGLANSMPVSADVTSERLAILRLHGRKTETWEKSVSVEEKFDYVYSTGELKELVPVVRELADKSERVHVVFNNCVRDHAVLNAREMARLVERG